MDYRFIKINNKDNMIRLLEKYNDYFIESMESRVGNLSEYADKLLYYAITYALDIDGATAGVIVFYANNKEKKEAYLTMIAVDKVHQGKGYGSLLLKYCEKKAKEAGMNRLSLEVDLRNRSAVVFYEKNGFKYKDKAAEHTVYLSKELS